MKDLNGYMLRMELAIDEKIKFLKYIDINEYDLVVDFGCANGALLRKLRQYNQISTFYGFDTNKEMIDAAKRHLDLYKSYYTNNWEEIKRELNYSNKSLIIIGSVFHEVDSMTEIKIVDLCKLFDTVVIRDMYNESEDKKIVLSGKSVSLLNSKISNHMWLSFSQEWGDPFDNLKQFYHFLLKYEYVDNWENEVTENYFRTDWDFIELELDNLFQKVADVKYTLPYKAKKVYQDFEYIMSEPTHRIMVFTRRLA